MKRNISFLTAVCMATALTECAGSALAAQETKAKKITLQYMTLADRRVLEAERYIIENYMEENPRAVVGTTSVPALDTFITTLKAKFAVGEEPDLYMFQTGIRVREFAQAGLLKDITNEPYMENVHEKDRAFNSLDGKIYGVPMCYEHSGLFANREVLANYPDIEIPASFQELMAACQGLQEQGLESPMILAGKGINNVAQFDLQCPVCVINHGNPDYYGQILDGELKFADDIFRKMFDEYGQLKECASDDALGMGDDGATKRFIRGEGAFWVAHGGEIMRMRELRDDESDFVMVPTVLRGENQERTFSCGQALALSVVGSSEYPDKVRGFVAEFLSSESSNIMASEGKIIPAAVGAEKLPDPCLEPCREWFDGDKKMVHADSIWVPGIKDTMKEITQKWYMGNSTESVLVEWDSQHHRLLEANPDFIKNFERN